MRRPHHFVIAVLSLAVLAAADRLAAQVPDAAVCAAAASAAEAQTGIPRGLLAAISRVESGEPGAGSGGSGWPWTINAHGEGHFFTDKTQAVTAARHFMADGVASMDLGCLQVDWQAHPGAFTSLEQAFDPAVNATVAAGILAGLYRQTGTWPRATAAYHSMTPGIGQPYAQKVLAAWANAAAMPRPDPRLPFRAIDGAPETRLDTLADAAPAHAVSGAAPPPVSARRVGAVLPASAGTPVTAVPRPGAGMRTGVLTLAAYRAFPVRLAFRAPLPRVIHSR